MKTAIIYDWLDSWGGVERMLFYLSNMFPEAVWYTSFYDKDKATWVKSAKINKIHTSFMQHLPKVIKKSRIFSLLFFSYAFESFDLSEYDRVITVSSSFSKGVITKPKTKHILILLTPTRWLYDQASLYKKQTFFPLLSSIFQNFFINNLLKWDYVAAHRPDKILSISETVKNRCLKQYKIKTDIVYPPFDYNYWFAAGVKSKPPRNLKNEIGFKSFYLVVSRLEPYKNIDVAIKAFNNSRRNLIIVGSGSMKNTLKKIANNNIVFIEKVSDGELAYLYKNAKALLMPQEEDFGYVALEAQVFNLPIIGVSKGGLLETIAFNNRKFLYQKSEVKSITDEVDKLEKSKYNVTIDKTFFEKFSHNNFKNVVLKEVLQKNI